MTVLLRLEAAEARVGSGAAQFALGPLSLGVAAGDCLVVLGRNGAGKSTLLALALGHLPLWAGRVQLLGDDPATLPRREVARRAVLLRQQPPPAFALTALEVVLHGRWPHQRGLGFASQADTDAAHEALERVEAAGLAARDVRSLSGGERQRVFLAKALAQRSPVLLLDEPTAGLDLRGRSDLVALLAARGRREGLALVLVTHELDVAAELADQVLVLEQGRSALQGPAPVVLAAPGLLAALGLRSPPARARAEDPVGQAESPR